MTLDKLVDHYLTNWPIGPEESWYGGAKSLSEAIRRACRSIDGEGRLHSHQWRIPKSTYAEATNALMTREEAIRQAENFEELLSTVEQALKPVYGAGELLVYDIAERIGWHLQLLPSEVYMHRGTRDGAQKLGLERSARSILLDQFPDEITNRLTAPQIESFLCLYKKHLRPISLKGLPVPPDSRGGC